MNSKFEWQLGRGDSGLARVRGPVDNSVDAMGTSVDNSYARAA